MWKYSIESSLYKIYITGGSVIIIDKSTNMIKKEFKGYNYLYTGAISPNESEFFALENGKHFFVYSLKKLELKQKITLPRGYEAIDVLGFYSEDGETLNIPAHRYVYENKKLELGHYEYILCKYSTIDYTLLEKVKIPDIKPYYFFDYHQYIY